jgi:hypothetical protein
VGQQGALLVESWGKSAPLCGLQNGEGLPKEFSTKVNVGSGPILGGWKEEGVMQIATLVSRIVLGSLLAVLVVSPSGAANTVTIDGSFADWTDEFCRPDNACGDFAGQRDAKGACVASNFVTPGPATTVYLRFDFDVTGLPGANTADGCWLVDVNQNGNVDRGLCFSLQGNPLVIQTTQMFTCDDSTTVTCGVPVPVASSVACAVNSNVTTDRLLKTCSGDSADTGVECSISLADLGWVSGKIFKLWACTHTSAQPNVTSFDCIVDENNPLIIDPENGDNVPVELQEFSVE